MWLLILAAEIQRSVPLAWLYGGKRAGGLSVIPKSDTGGDKTICVLMELAGYSALGTRQKVS
jgi:hypothetical protein